MGDKGIPTQVIDPRWVLPVPSGLADIAGRMRLVATIEDNSRYGGVGTAVRASLEDAGVSTPVRTFGVPHRFLQHATRAQTLQATGLTAQDISRQVVESVAALLPDIESVPHEG